MTCAPTCVDNYTGRRGVLLPIGSEISWRGRSCDGRRDELRRYVYFGTGTGLELKLRLVKITERLAETIQRREHHIPSVSPNTRFEAIRLSPSAKTGFSIAWYIESPESAQPLLPSVTKAGRSFYTALGHLNTSQSPTHSSHSRVAACQAQQLKMSDT